jgi:condensin complex subunit 3
MHSAILTVRSYELVRCLWFISFFRVFQSISHLLIVVPKVSKLKAKRPPIASASSSPPLSSPDDDDTLASRFVARVLKWLLHGFVAKNKNVRFRCVHIVSEMISHLGELE